MHVLPSSATSDPRQAASAPELTCWTRMQAEAGQCLDAIVRRKEAERRAGGGLFFWGVGNAPSREIRNLAHAGRHVEVAFSKMLGSPKSADAAPEAVVAWQRYVDMSGVVRPVPEHVLVTSQGGTRHRPKDRHYALICRSEEPLALSDLGPFDPSCYRNAGPGGAPPGASQVTALLVRTGPAGAVPGRYRINLRAELAMSYWVKLVDPIAVGDDARRRLGDGDPGPRLGGWLTLVRSVREHAALPDRPRQHGMLL